RSNSTGDQQHAAANIVRDKIDNIYDQAALDAAQIPASQSPQPQGASSPQTIEQQYLTIENPYRRTHTSAPKPQVDHWKQYHTAWQDYYQKYYERYYVSKVQEATSKLATQPSHNTPDKPQVDQQRSAEASRKQDDAIYELRSKLRAKV